MIHRIARLALLTSATPLLLAAQSWRTFDATRQLRDTTPYAVHVTYGAGRVTVRPGVQPNLFDMHLKYDAERSEPVYQFNASTRQVDIGVRQRSGIKSFGDSDGSALTLDLSRAAPLRLQLDVGAAQGDFDLSGLQIDELTLQTGATETRVRFDKPNPRRMRSLRVDMGAASVEIGGLANANAEHIDVNVGVGHIALDFAGEWRGDVAMTVNSALGNVRITVPNAVGVRVESSKFLSSFDAKSMVKKNGAWESSNWETARYKLRVRSTGVLGHFEITRQPH